MTIRLIKVCSELKVEIATVVDTLVKKGIKVEAIYSTKITERQYLVLKEALLKEKMSVKKQKILPSKIKVTGKIDLTHITKKQTPEVEPESEQLELWNKFIIAQRMLLKKAEGAIKVVEDSVKVIGNSLQLKIDQRIYKHVFLRSLDETFQLCETDIDPAKGYLLQDCTRKIPPEKIEALQEEADRFYFEFYPDLVIEGIVRAKKQRNFSLLSEIEKDGSVKLTLAEKNSWKRKGGTSFNSKTGLEPFIPLRRDYIRLKHGLKEIQESELILAIT